MGIDADLSGPGGRSERANVRRFPSFLFLAAILSAGISGALAEVTADPVQKLTGKWDVPGTTTSIYILPDHFVFHSRLGRGDIKWENAAYYTIAYRERSITCHYLVRVRSRTDLALLRYENTDLPECDLGEMRRSTPQETEEQAREQGATKPDTTVREPETGPTRNPATVPDGPAHTPPIAPAQPKYYFVWDTRPPDNWLDMWEYPNSRGHHIRRMTNGTPLELVQKGPGKWYLFRNVETGETGWVAWANGSGSRVWVYCCRTLDGLPSHPLPYGG